MSKTRVYMFKVQCFLIATLVGWIPDHPGCPVLSTPRQGRNISIPPSTSSSDRNGLESPCCLQRKTFCILKDDIYCIETRSLGPRHNTKRMTSNSV